MRKHHRQENTLFDTQKRIEMSMELKSYQHKGIENLEEYLDYVQEKKDLSFQIQNTLIDKNKCFI